MGDILGSFSTGYQTGQAAYKAEQEKKAKAAREAAEFNLKLASESRLLTGAAEESWGKIESAINDPNWDVSRLPQVLQAAATHDKTYGKIWQGGKATERVMEALHMNKVKAAVPRTPTDLGNTVEINADDPMRGYATTEQINNAEKLKQEMRTREVLPVVQKSAEKYMMSHAMVNGMLDPDLAITSLYEWSAEAQAETGADPVAIQQTMDNFIKGIGAVFKERAKGSGKEGEYNAHVEAVTKDANAYVDKMLGTSDAMGNISFTDSARATKVRASDAIASLAMAGFQLPEIMVRLSKMLGDPTTGKWQEGGPAMRLYMSNLAQSPPGFEVEMNKKYRAGSDPAMWEPYYDPSTGVGYLVNIKDRQQMKIWPPVGAPVEQPAGKFADAGPWKAGSGATQEPAPAAGGGSGVQPKENPVKVKKPEVPIEQLLAKSPGDMTGQELARVMKNMTGQDFVKWMKGEYVPKAGS